MNGWMNEWLQGIYDIIGEKHGKFTAQKGNRVKF